MNFEQMAIWLKSYFIRFKALTIRLKGLAVAVAVQVVNCKVNSRLTQNVTVGLLLTTLTKVKIQR